jgi:hypothetical protein
LHDLGPVAATRHLARKLRKTHAREDAAALYNHLFGTLDDELKRYDPLYLVPDGFLEPLRNPQVWAPFVLVEGP